MSRVNMAILAVALFAGCVGRQDARKEPRGKSCLAVDPTVIDLGDVAINTERDVKARVVNRGRGTIVIERVTSSCGCTEAKLDAMQLRAGGTADLSAVFHAGPRPGPSYRQIIVDPSNGRPVLLKVMANLVRTVRWSPDVLVLRPSFFATRSDVGAFVITNASGDPVEVRPDPNDHSKLSMKLERSVIQPGQDARIILTADSMCLERQELVISLQTSHACEARLELPVKIQPEQFVELKPKAIHFGVISKEELLSRKELEVHIRGSALSRLTLKEVKALSYLRFLKYETNSPESGVLFFAIVDRFHGIDLKGTLSLLFLHLRTAVSIDVPVSGFLAESE